MTTERRAPGAIWLFCLWVSMRNGGSLIVPLSLQRLGIRLTGSFEKVSLDLFSDLRQVIELRCPSCRFRTGLRPNCTAFPTARAAQRQGELVAYLAAARAMGYWLNLASLSKRIDITGLNFEYPVVGQIAKMHSISRV
jgi:hypothetical protein